MVDSSTMLDSPKQSSFELSTPLQKCAAVLAICSAFITEMLVIKWMATNGEYYLGGLNWDNLLFNFHPIFMVLGMLFFFVTAIVSFRVLPFEHSVNKKIHGVLHSCAMICITIGLCAVFMGNNYKSKGGIYANLYSMHSYLGLSAIVLYSLNFFGGLIWFGFGDSLGIEKSVRKAYKPTHVFMGTFSFFVATMAVETGVVELMTELGCGYDVGTADFNPAKHYHLLPEGCQIANGIGIMTLLTALFGSYAVLTPFPEKSSDEKPLLKDVL